MTYFVWLQYYLTPPGKTVKSDELRFADGHQHGVQPSQAQVNSLQPDLQARVARVAQQAGVAYPGDAVVASGRTVHTRSQR